MTIFGLKSVLACLLLSLAVTALAANALTLLDRTGGATTALTDGDQLVLHAELDEPVSAGLAVSFELDGSGPVAACRILAGDTSCSSSPVNALGWYWSEAGEPRPFRALSALDSGGTVLAQTAVEVIPRPVVLIHGFTSSASTWAAYLDSEGFLSRLGLRGFAVGDPPEAGRLNLGTPLRPRQRTDTLAENAEALARYISLLKEVTGAQMVDLVAHSMGGLVARVYIARLMAERDVAQLIMIGTPNGGSPCARLPAALGFHLPAALELRPAYVRDVLNPQLGERRGVPFATLAGTPIADAFRSPCTGRPTDLVVSRSSAGSIGAVEELPVLHTEQTSSDAVFAEFVAPLLTRPANTFVPEPDEFIPVPEAESPQVTQVFTGSLLPGETRDLTVHLDAVAVASFALYDPTLSLETSVRGASGQQLELSPERNGLVQIDDPASLLQLGYGFEHPQPGPWQISLRATARTPAAGAPFALSAQVVGGALLQASTSTLLPEVGETVTLTTELTGEEQLETLSVEAVIRRPDGATQTLALEPAGSSWHTTWRPVQRGLHGIDVTARAESEAGLIVERTVFLAVDVQRGERDD